MKQNRNKPHQGIQSNAYGTTVDAAIKPASAKAPVTPAFIIVDAEFIGENPSQPGFPAKLLVAPALGDSGEQRAVYVHKEFARESIVQADLLRAQAERNRAYINELHRSLEDVRSSRSRIIRNINALPLKARIKAVFRGYRATDLV